MVAVHKCGQRHIHMHWKWCHACWGSGGSVAGYTIEMNKEWRKYIERYKWKYSCSISATENVHKALGHAKKKTSVLYILSLPHEQSVSHSDHSLEVGSHAK